MFNNNSVQGSYIGNAGVLAGNPFGSDFQIPGKRPIGQPALPGENKGMIEGVYGQPGPQSVPGASPLRLPMAMGMPVMDIGNVGGMSTTLNPLVGDALPLAARATVQQMFGRAPSTGESTGGYTGIELPSAARATVQQLFGRVADQEQPGGDELPLAARATVQQMFGRAPEDADLGNPFARYIQGMENMQQVKQAGFNRKTVS